MQAEPHRDALHAALAYEDASYREPLKAAVAAAGGTVTRELRLSAIAFPEAVSEPILVVNLEAEVVERPELLEWLLAFPGRLVLNDAEASARLGGAARARWMRHLAAKITGSGRVYPASPGAVPGGGPAEAPVSPEVWILAASIGGPEAMRSFLGELSPAVPFCLVLAQHIGMEFIGLMAEQLDQASRLPVKIAIDGEPFRPGRVYVVPPGRSFAFDGEGRICLGEPVDPTPYSPDINAVIRNGVGRFGARANVIVFSGMASDAVDGCEEVRRAGGQVWVQEPATCVVSSMVDGALARGGVGFRADPVHLAHRLNERGIELH